MVMIEQQACPSLCHTMSFSITTLSRRVSSSSSTNFSIVFSMFSPQPLAVWGKLREENIHKLPESAWRCICHCVTWSFAAYVLLSRYPDFFTKPHTLFKGLSLWGALPSCVSVVSIHWSIFPSPVTTTEPHPILHSSPSQVLFLLVWTNIII